MFISYAPAVKFKYLHGDCLLKQCRILHIFERRQALSAESLPDRAW